MSSQHHRSGLNVSVNRRHSTLRQSDHVRVSVRADRTLHHAVSCPPGPTAPGFTHGLIADVREYLWRNKREESDLYRVSTKNTLTSKVLLGTRSFGYAQPSPSPESLTETLCVVSVCVKCFLSVRHSVEGRRRRRAVIGPLTKSFPQSLSPV